MLGVLALAARTPSVYSAQHSRLPMTTKTGSWVAPSSWRTRAYRWPPRLRLGDDDGVGFSSWKNLRYFFGQDVQAGVFIVGPRTPRSEPRPSFSGNVMRAPVCFAVRPPGRLDGRAGIDRRSALLVSPGLSRQEVELAPLV